MKNGLSLLVAFFTAAAGASAGGLAVGGYYAASYGPEYDYFGYGPSFDHGGGAKLTWRFADPVGAEFAFSPSWKDERGGIWFPEYHPPDRRTTLQLTASLFFASRIWRLEPYALAGVGLAYELNRCDFLWREVDYPSTAHPLAVWGVGIRAYFAERWYVEFSPRYVAMTGDQLAFWDMNDGFRYRDGHPDVLELTAGVAYGL
jgi:hypothetical protein